MKKVLYIIAIIALTIVSLVPQSVFAKEKKAQKEHICTTACQKGEHILSHEEKGHICSDTCKANLSKKTQSNVKPHLCTSSCQNGNHNFLHGEVGHVCGEACMKK